MLVLYIFCLLVIFYLLAQICEAYFIKSLNEIAHRIQISEDVAGATLMAIGSSAPELFTSLFALTKVGSENIGAGTIIGSAIFNILVIIGGTALVATAYLNWKPVLRDLGFYLLSIILLLTTFIDGKIYLWEALLYLGVYALYIGVMAKWRKWVPEAAAVTSQLDTISANPETSATQSTAWYRWPLQVLNRLLAVTFPRPGAFGSWYLAMFAISLAWIIGLSWLLVEVGIAIAHGLGVPEVIIALTVLAGGTSIPDLLSSLIVAREGRGDMAVSNALGSNSFDILFGLGFPWLLYILLTGNHVTVSTENLTASILLLLATVISVLFILIVRKFRIGRKSGLVLIFAYIAYLIYAVIVAL